MMSHLDDGLINELLDGEIPSAQLPPIQEHLARCGECRGRLESARLMVMESDDLIEALDEPTVRAATPVLPFAPRRTSWPRKLAWAASVTIAVGAGYLARGEQLLPTPVLTDSGTARSESLSATPPAVRLESPAQSSDQPGTPVDARRNAANRAESPSQGFAVPVETDGVAEPPALAVREDEQIVRRDSNVGNLAGERERQEAARPMAAAPPPEARNRALDAASGAGRATSQLEATRLAPRDQAAAKSVVAIDTISLPDAVRLLGGSLRLIDGLVPLRLEAVGSEVRVIYPLAMGSLQLTQRLIGERVTWNLIAPSGFPADSLAVLRSRVKE